MRIGQAFKDGLEQPTMDNTIHMAGLYKDLVFAPSNNMVDNKAVSIPNGGSEGTTSWIDSNADNLPDNWTNLSEGNYTYSIVSGNGFTENAFRVEFSSPATALTGITSGIIDTSAIEGLTASVSMKMRANGSYCGVSIVNAETGAAIATASSYDNQGDAIYRWGWGGYTTVFPKKVRIVIIGWPGIWMEVSELKIAGVSAINSGGYTKMLQDKSGFNNNVSLFNATIEGALNNPLVTSEENSIILPPHAMGTYRAYPLDIDRGFTVGIWFKYTQNGVQYSSLLEDRTSGSETNSIFLLGFDGREGNGRFRYTAGTHPYRVYGWFGNVMTIGKWYHGMIVIKNGDFRTYFNGELTSTSVAVGKQIPDSSITLRKLGMNNADPIEVKQPLIYNRALTSEEIRLIYSSGGNI